MFADRRLFLGVAAGAAALPTMVRAASGAPSVRVQAAGAPAATRAAMDRLVNCAATELAAFGWPGMTLAFLAPDGSSATATLGLAQMEAGAAVRPDQLFQVGSISKSFVALALLRLSDEGRIDLDRPMLEIAPDLPIEDGRVTPAHILSHAAGFPGNTPPFAPVNGGKLWSATEPGARFSYSNSGYDMLALLIERLTRRPFDAALAELVLKPLAMAQSEPVIRTADRPRYARGYLAMRRDRPYFPGDVLAEGAWLDIDRAAGSVASTGRDMLRYMALLAACAAGRPQPLLSLAAARRWTTAVIGAPDFGPGARYGMGWATIPIDERPALHHTGGMVTFSSACTVDAGSGGGGFASVNVGAAMNYRPRAVTAYAVRMARAMAAGAKLPDPPAPTPTPPLPDAAALAGPYRGPGDLALDFAPAPGGLALRVNGRPARLKAYSPTLFWSDHPRLVAHAFSFEEEGARLWHGNALYARGSAPDQPRPPARLLALAGLYRSNDPWVGDASLVAQGDRLVLEGQGALRETTDGTWRFEEPEAVTERVQFGPLVNGRAQTVGFSGEVMVRAAG